MKRIRVLTAAILVIAVSFAFTPFFGTAGAASKKKVTVVKSMNINFKSDAENLKSKSTIKYKKGFITGYKDIEGSYKLSYDKKYRITKIEVIDDNVDTDNSLKPEPQPEPTVSSEESASSNQNSNTDGDTDKYSMISRSTSSAQTQSQSTTTVLVPQQQDNTTHTSPSENNNNSRQQEEQVPSEPEEEKLEGSVEYKGDYSDVIRGGLNREQLELVLSWIDNQYCNDKVDDSNVMIVLNYFAEDIRVNNNRGFTYNGEDSNKRIILSAKEMNSLLASFSNYDIFSSSLFSTETEYGSYIDGDNYLHLSVSTVDNKASINANITKAEYNDSEMWIHYSGTQGDRTAILINTGGEYHITEVRLY